MDHSPMSTPVELVALILSFTPAEDVARTRQTCEWMRMVTDDNESFITNRIIETAHAKLQHRVDWLTGGNEKNYLDLVARFMLIRGCDLDDYDRESLARLTLQYLQRNFSLQPDVAENQALNLSWFGSLLLMFKKAKGNQTELTRLTSNYNPDDDVDRHCPGVKQFLFPNNASPGPFSLGAANGTVDLYAVVHRKWRQNIRPHPSITPGTPLAMFVNLDLPHIDMALRTRFRYHFRTAEAARIYGQHVNQLDQMPLLKAFLHEQIYFR